MPLAATPLLSFTLIPAQTLTDLEEFHLGDYGSLSSQFGLLMFFAGLAMIIYAMTLGTTEGKFVGGRVFGFGIVIMTIGVAAQYVSEATSGSGNLLRTYQLSVRDLIMAGLLLAAVMILRPLINASHKQRIHDPNAARRRARNTALIVTAAAIMVMAAVVYKAREDAARTVIGLGPIITHEVVRSEGKAMVVSPEDPLEVTIREDEVVDVVMLACEMFTEIIGVTDHKAVFDSVPGRECRITLGRDGQPYAPVYQGDDVECWRERNGTRCTGGAAQANMAHLFIAANGPAELKLQRRPMELPIIDHVAKPGSHLISVKTPDGLEIQKSVTTRPNERVYIVFNLPNLDPITAERLQAEHEEAPEPAPAGDVGEGPANGEDPPKDGVDQQDEEANIQTPQEVNPEGPAEPADEAENTPDPPQP